MLSHTRVSGLPDPVRIARAVAAPGIDPRPWQSYAVVDAVGIDSEGVFVDLTLLPSEHPATARVGADYAGPGYGSFMPIGVDDEVLVAAPDGDPQHGMVVVRRMFSASDNLPQAAIDNPNDLVLVVKPKQSYRIVVSDGGKLILGAELATDAAVLGTTYRSAEDVRFGAMDTLAEALGAAIAALAAAVPTLTGTPAQLTAWTAAVGAVATALTAYTGAVATFGAGAAGYLSQSVEVAP